MHVGDFPDPKCLFYPSGTPLCLSVVHFHFVPVDDTVLFHGIVCLSLEARDSVISRTRAPSSCKHSRRVIKMSDGHQNVVIR